jgi:hypothetical protein
MTPLWRSWPLNESDQSQPQQGNIVSGPHARAGTSLPCYERPARPLAQTVLAQMMRLYLRLLVSCHGVGGSLATPASSGHTLLAPVWEEPGVTGFGSRGLPLDEIEDLLPKSSAYRQALPILFSPIKHVEGRPLLPLHAGYLGLLAVSSLIDGIFGSDQDHHVSAWRSIKVTDRSEKVEDDGTIIQRERERFTNELTLVYASGKTAILH